jgi:hypothetical protein
MNYYSPYKAYCDRSHIYNFLPHPGESIAQAWRRLKGLLLKNPNHRFSQGIILINFYVWLDKPYKEFLDNFSDGSFTHCTVTEACELLEKISKNTDNWDLDRGNEPT